MFIDHLGVAVRSLEKGIENWERQFGYRRATEPVINTRQMVRVVFMEKEGSLPIKLVEPTGPTSPVFPFVQKGGGLHHVCFRLGDLDQSIEALREQGGRVLAPPQPGEAFDDEPIAFVLAQPGLNVELIATDKRRGRIQPSSDDETNGTTAIPR